MPGLCGWLEARPGKHPAAGSLARMAEGLPPSERTRPASAAEPDRALHLDALPAEGQLHTGPRYWAALEGVVWWSDPALAALAKTDGHAAALAVGFDRHGAEVLTRLHGGFSLAVLDRAGRRALLAIDRMGIHRLCYGRAEGGGLVFGSTTEAVRRHPGTTATISAQAVYDYFLFYVSPAPTTIYEEQRKLLPAQYLLWDDGATQTGFYWRMPYQERNGQSFAALREELTARLREAVTASLDAPEAGRIGAFLSGGLDSSTVLGLAQQARGNVTAFTIGFGTAAFDEMDYAKIAVERFGADHVVHYLTPEDMREAIGKLAAAYDEPFANSSAIPAYCCARIAREHGIDLMLAGDGGDEIFAGNRRYITHKIFDCYAYLPEPVRRYLIEPTLRRFPGGEGFWPVRKARRYLEQAELLLVDRLRAENEWSPVRLEDAFDEARAGMIDPDEPWRLVRDIYERTNSASPLHRMLHVDLKLTLADNDLRKVQSACGLADLSVRFPFLDERLVEFSARIPPHLQIRGFNLRHFFKQAMKDYLPKTIIAKKKHGFGMPYGQWLKEDPVLRRLALDSVAAFRDRRFLKTAYLDSLLDQAAGNDAAEPQVWDPVWDILMLEHWLQAHR